MRFKLTLVLACCFVCSGCIKSDCPTVCTDDLVVVSVKFINASGTALSVTDFTAVNTRTGEEYQYVHPDQNQFKGTYIVVTDAHKRGLSARGDTIDVKATNPQTGQQKNALFVVTGGGDCICHISKVSGPDRIAFD